MVWDHEVGGSNPSAPTISNESSMADDKRSGIFAGLGCTAFVLLVVFALAGTLSYLYWTSPRYSLRQAKNAVERRDIAGFEKYVDVRGVCDSAVDRFLDEAQREGDDEDDGRPRKGGDALGRMLGAGLLRLAKPMLVDALRSELRKGIAEGRVAGGEKKPQVHIEQVERTGATADAWLRMPGHAFDPPRERDVRVRLRLRDMGHYWQAYEVTALEGFSKER